MGEQPYSASSQSASHQGYRRPLIATVILIALLSLFFSAGFWQLGRAAEKRATLARFDSASAAGVSDEILSNEDAANLRFHSVQLTGHYVPERQILLDNMTDGGTNGYQVLTLFRTATGAVLVNRGWVPAPTDRDQLPAIEVAAEPRTIRARINHLPAPGLRLAPTVNAETSWPRRMLFPTAEQLADTLETRLPDYQLQLDPDQPDGYLREWQAVESGPAKHLGYAFQWFGFATLACIFYVILMYQWLRARRAPVAHTPTTPVKP